jgi:hypothetical protein
MERKSPSLTSHFGTKLSSPSAMLQSSRAQAFINSGSLITPFKFGVNYRFSGGS